MDALLKKPPSTETVSPDPNSSDSKTLDIYRILRGQIEHEDNLVGSRISWFVTSQSFLFSAYAIIAGGIQPNASKTGLDAKHVLLVVVPSMAIVTSILIMISIVSGFEAMRLIRHRYNQLLSSTDHEQLPALQGSRRTRLAGMAAPVLLPPLFMAVWIFLLIRRLF
jgi:hypothetical protein